MITKEQVLKEFQAAGNGRRLSEILKQYYKQKHTHVTNPSQRDILTPELAVINSQEICEDSYSMAQKIFSPVNDFEQGLSI